MERILIAIDGSPASDEAVELGVELAAEQHAAVTFVHVVRPLDVVPMNCFGLAAGARPHDVTEEERQPLVEAKAAAERQGVHATAKLLVGDVVDEIVAYADNLDADLIVIGSRGHGTTDQRAARQRLPRRPLRVEASRRDCPRAREHPGSGCGGSRPLKLRLAVITLAGLGLLYERFLRATILTWGATKAEAAATLPGDELLAAADGIATRAIRIDAPPSAVWPWIAQMGPSPRGGAYSYDWIENLLGLDMHSADRVLPEFQHPQLGDTIGYGSNRMRIERVEPEHVLAWRSEDGNWVWTFILESRDSSTQLISRNRFRLPSVSARLGMVPMEPASLVMERRMLRGIKQRAERLHLQRTRQNSAVGAIDGPPLAPTELTTPAIAPVTAAIGQSESLGFRQCVLYRGLVRRATGLFPPPCLL